MAKITIEKLAVMVQKGFAGTTEQINDLKEDMTILKKDVAVLKKDVKDVKYKLTENGSNTNKLETRVEYIENILNLSIKKN